MIVIELKKVGTFLSGRSLAQEIVDISLPQDKYFKDNSITVNFLDIENVSQSFLSEFFFRIAQKSINLDNLNFMNIENKSIQDRIIIELERVKNFAVSA